MLLAMTMFHAVRIQQQGPDSAELSSVPMESLPNIHLPNECTYCYCTIALQQSH